MSTLQKINFTPVTDIIPVQRRDFPLADKTLAQPLNPVALVDGEWLIVNDSGQAQRATDVTSVGANARSGAHAVRSYPLFAERGRSDVQAMSMVKMPLLYLGVYEADTRIFDVAAGTPIAFVGQPLKVMTITFGGRNFSGLVGANVKGTETEPVVGYVTRLPTNNNGQLRFMSGWGS